MQELKKKHRKKPKKELERGAQKEQKNLTDITEEQLKVNIGIVRLGNMIKVIQIVMKVLLCMLAVLFSFLAILLHEAANWMLATWTNLSMEELVAQLKTPIQGTSHEVLWDFVETCIPAAVMAVFFVVLVIVMVRKTKITKWVVQIGAVAGSMALIVSSGQMVWRISGKSGYDLDVFAGELYGSGVGSGYISRAEEKSGVHFYGVHGIHVRFNRCRRRFCRK